MILLTRRRIMSGNCSLDMLRQQYKELLVKNTTLKIEIDRKQQSIDKLKNDVMCCQEELERHWLEEKWLNGENSEVQKLAPEVEADHICQRIVEQDHSDIAEDIFLALRQKKSVLDSHLFELQKELKKLKDDG